MILKIEGNINKFVRKCISKNIIIKSIEYHDKYSLIEINKEDYKKVKRISYYAKISKYRDTGFLYIKNIIKKFWYDFLMIILFIIIIYFQSNIIISVSIKHENKTLKNKVKEILIDYNIKPFTFKMSNKKLNEISDEILRNNRDILDFIAINRNGMKLTISLEERIINKEEIKDTYCHVISNKDAIISDITVYSGVSLVEKNQYVKKGDILISGDLILNEEIKNQVCADGIIKGITWYKVNVSYPKTEVLEEFSGKHKYNLSINNRFLLKNKFNKYKSNTKWKFLNIKIVDIKEIKENEITYSNDELKKLAISKAKSELMNKFSGKIKIIDEKVLKDEYFNSKIELELFISIEEDIGIKKVGVLNDPEQGI